MSGMINDFVVIPPPSSAAPPPPIPSEAPAVAATPVAPAPTPTPEVPSAPITDFVVAAPAPVPSPATAPVAPTPVPAAPSLATTMVGAPPPEDTGEGLLSGIFAGNRAAGRELRRTAGGQAFELDPNAPIAPEHRTWLNEFGYGFGHSVPAIGAGLVGGAIGAAAGSAVPVVGTGVGGAVGAGLGVAGMSLAQELAPAYAEARARGMDHDAAVDYAWTRGGATGVVSGLFGMIPGGKTIIGNLLLQSGVVQPVSGAATRTIVPLVTGDPLPTTEEYIRGLGQDVASGAAFAAGHSASRAVNRLALGREPPLSPEILAAQQRAAQEEAARQQQYAAEQQAAQQGAPQQPQTAGAPPVGGQEQGVPPGERTRLTIDQPTGAPDAEVAPVTVRPTEPAPAPDTGAVPGARVEPTETGTPPVGRGPEVPGATPTERPGTQPPLGETGAPPVEPTPPARPGAAAPPEGAGPTVAQPERPAAPVAGPTGTPTGPPRFRTEPDDAHPGQHVAKDENGNVVGKGATPDEAAGDALRRGGQPYPPEPAPTAPTPTSETPTAPTPKHEFTGQTTYRGEGRQDQGSVYGPMSAGVPVAGEGRYSAFDRGAAERFGPNVTEHPVDLENPLIIRSGQEWQALTREAGWQTPNPSGRSREQVLEQTQRLKELIQSKGHDGLIVHWDDSIPYDIDSQGRNIKLLRAVFDTPQVVDYRGAPSAEPTRPAEARVVPPGGDETVPVRPGEVGAAEGRPAAVGETLEPTGAPAPEAEAARPAAPAPQPRTEVPGAAAPVPERAPAVPAPSKQLTALRTTRDQMEANPNLSFRDSVRLNQIKAQIGALERTEAAAARAQQRTQQREMRAARSQAEAEVAARRTGETGGARVGGVRQPYREPETGRKPNFYDYQFADGTSVYRSVFRDMGYDPDTATSMPIRRQNEILAENYKNKFGYQSVEITGRRPGEEVTEVQHRIARDYLLDLTRATTDMFSTLGYPMEAGSLGGRVKFRIFPEGRPPFGMYSWGSDSRTINMMAGANSYGHEWTHALDHMLTERYTTDPTELLKMLSQVAREGKPPLDIKDPVQYRFAQVLNAMFHDKAAMAVKQLDLENKALRTDAQGNPTKAALEARRQLELMEAGGSRLHMQPTEFRIRSASLGDPAYWASAHEMLARANEAFIAREMQQNGVNPRGVVMPDAAYINQTDRMLANAYPKGGELQRIFAALADMHREIRNAQIFGTAPPAKWADYGVSDPHYWPTTAPQTKGNFMTRPIRREIESYRGWSQKALNAWPFDPTRPKGPLSLPTQMADAFRAVAYSARGLMQTYIARAPEGAQPYLQKILDLLTTDPATGRYTPENFEEAWKHNSSVWHRRMGNILGDHGIELERMTVEQGLMLRHVMTEGDPRAFPVDVMDPSKGTKPIPANIVRAGGAMRDLMEEIWFKMHRAGFDIGYAKSGYFPRMYDIYAVLSDPGGFKDAASRLHRLIFDREVSGDPGAMVERWRQLSGPNREQAPQGLADEVGKLQSNLRRQGRLEADLRRRAELEGNSYRSPEEDAELARLKPAADMQAELARLQADADTLAQGLHDPLGDHIATMAAEQWYARFMGGGLHDFDAMGPSSGFMSARSLPPEADRIMRDFMYSDPRVALPQYFQSAARRLAFGERFGTKGEELQRLLDAARAVPGANPHDIAEFESYANLVMGRMNNHAQTRRSMKIASSVGALGQVALMPRAAWSSLTEPMAGNIVTGDVRTGFKIIANQFGQLMKTSSALQRTQIAEYLGIVKSAMEDSVMMSRNNADYSNMPAINRLLTHFYRITGLTQLTNSQRVGTMAASNWYLSKLAYDYLNTGKSNRAADARDEATRWFNELGVKEGNHREFAQWLTDLNGALPSIHRLEVDPMGSVYGLAVRRMVDRIIQDPTKADRPAISHGAFGSLVAQLMNFNYQFQKNVLTPMFMKIEHAYGRAKVRAVDQGAGPVGATTAGLVAGAGAVSHAAAMAGSVLAAGFMTTMLRQYLFAPDQWDAHVEKDDLVDWLSGLTFARAGFNGTLDPLIQVASNLRYNTDLTDLLDGATIRWAAQNAQDVIAPFIRDNESPNTNTQYYNQARGAFNLIGVPLAATGLSMLGAAGGPITRFAAGTALQFGTSPGAAGAFASTLAGDKGTKLPKETESLGDLPNMGDLGTLGNLDKAGTDAEEAGGMVTPWGLIDDMIAPAWRYTAPWINRLGTKTKVGALAAGAGYGVWDYLDKTAPYREASEAAKP